MGRSIASTTSTVSVGQTQEFIDADSIINNGEYIKANGQQLNKVDYPLLSADLVESSNDYSKYSITDDASISTLFNHNAEVATLFNVGTKFYHIYEDVATLDVSISESVNGTDWNYPVVIDSANTFRNFRVFGTDIFICTATGVFKGDGITWTKVYGHSAYDIAFNGMTKYIISNYTTVLHSSLDLITWTAEPALPISPVSIVWSGTKFLTVTLNNAAAYWSTDGVTWTLVTLPIAVIGGVAVKISVVNGNVIVPVANTVNFIYSDSACLTWTNSAQAFLGAYPVTIIWNGTKYIIGSLLSAVNTTGKIGITTALNIAPTYYTIGANTAGYDVTTVAYNGTTYVVSTANSGTYCHLATYSSEPTTALSINYIFPSFKSNLPVLGNGYFTAKVSSANHLVLLVEDAGVFKIKKALVAQFYFTVSTLAILIHYAKDAKLFYYTTVAPINGMTVYTKSVSSTDIMGTDFAISAVYYGGTSLIFKHTNGIVFSTATINTGSILSGNTHITLFAKVTPTYYQYVSEDGKYILLNNGAAPYQAFQSSNYGKTFNIFSPSIFNSIGASITVTSTNSAMYMLNGKYYSSGGSYAGNTPFLLTEQIGIPNINGSTCKLGVNSTLIMGNSIRLTISLTSGGIMYLLDASAMNTAGAYTKANGDIIVRSTIGNTNSFKRTIVKPYINPLKFSVPNISSSTFGKAVYIKAK